MYAAGALSVWSGVLLYRLYTPISIGSERWQLGCRRAAGNGKESGWVISFHAPAHGVFTAHDRSITIVCLSGI